jgi:hypothetical protein
MMKALSLRQPWLWVIFNLGKRVENRKWRTHYRGRVLLHAAQGMTRQEHQDVVTFCERVQRNSGRKAFLPPWEVPRGAIVGAATIVDCVKQCGSPWFFGPFGFVLDNVTQFGEPIPCKGALGLWNVSDELERKVRRVAGDYV